MKTEPQGLIETIRHLQFLKMLALFIFGCCFVVETVNFFFLKECDEKTQGHHQAPGRGL